MRRCVFVCMGLLCLAFASGSSRAADLVRVTAGPFISGGAFYIARDKGYFAKLGISIETKDIDDGALAVPAIIAGEVDVIGMPAAASLFNSVAKGAPIVVFLDRGSNVPGHAYTVLSVSQKTYDEGVRSLDDLAKLKGKRIGVGALGSVNQYNVARALENAGLNPATDVQWIVNVPQQELMKMLGTGQLDAVDFAYQFGAYAQKAHWGPIIASDDTVVPNAPIVVYAVRKEFLENKRDVLVRFAMAFLQAAEEFNAAAAAPEQHPDVLDILARDTVLGNPDLVKSIAPHWSYVDESGTPHVAGTMAMQDFWAGHGFGFVQRKIAAGQLFDLSVAREAKDRLDREKPFGP